MRDVGLLGLFSFKGEEIEVQHVTSKDFVVAQVVSVCTRCHRLAMEL